jgi:hypothetical protein
VLPEKMMGKRQDVFPPLIQRRKPHGPARDSVEKIVAKLTEALRAEQFLISGTYQSEVAPFPRIASQALVRSFFDNA